MAEIEPIIEEKTIERTVFETTSEVVGYEFKLTAREAELIRSLIYVLPIYGPFHDSLYSAEGRELSARLAEAGVRARDLGITILRD